MARHLVALALALGSAIASVTVCADELAGEVVKVQDGDTLTLLVDRQQHRIRLLDIDAPERRQPFYQRSRQSLAEMCAGQRARVTWKARDRYDRILGRVVCSGVDANAEQVRRGMAWVFVRYAPKDSPLYQLEAQARVARRGIWSEAAAVVPPWDWRARKASH